MREITFHNLSFTNGEEVNYLLMEGNLRDKDRNRMVNIGDTYCREWKRVLTKDKRKLCWVVLEIRWILKPWIYSRTNPESCLVFVIRCSFWVQGWRKGIEGLSQGWNIPKKCGQKERKGKKKTNLPIPQVVKVKPSWKFLHLVCPSPAQICPSLTMIILSNRSTVDTQEFSNVP